MAKAKQKKQSSVYFTPAELKQLQKLADKQRTSRATIIRQAVAEMMERIRKNGK